MAERKSVYKRAAEAGLPFGIYLSVLSVVFIYTDQVSALSYLATAMFLATPVVIGLAQRHYFASEFGMSDFSTLWMYGLLMVIYGSIITSVVTFAVLQFLRPEYFYDMVQNLIAVYKKAGDPQMQETVQMLQQIVDANAVPRPIEMVFSMFWCASFIGSVLSAILAAVVRLIPYRENKVNDLENE